jgi:hypothetical protein
VVATSFEDVVLAPSRGAWPNREVGGSVFSDCLFGCGRAFFEATPLRCLAHFELHFYWQWVVLGPTTFPQKWREVGQRG